VAATADARETERPAFAHDQLVFIDVIGLHVKKFPTANATHQTR
jgi:hypothetical protein